MDLSIMQGLHDAIYHADKPGSTEYFEKDYVICVGSSISLDIPVFGRRLPLTIGGAIPIGGICVFPEKLNGGSVTLERVKTLADALLDSHCYTCGIIPINWPTDTNDHDPVLKFDFVSHPECTGNCITSDDIVVGDTTTSSTTTSESTTTSTTTSESKFGKFLEAFYRRLTSSD